MAYALTLVFEGVDEKGYLAVNALLGLSADGSGDWPAGILSHVAGPTPTGWIVSEIWDSKDSHQAFFAARLGSALAGAHVAPPVQMVETVAVGNYPPRA
ncbi:MAG: hypothetical protein P4L98_01480 [Ancalomicrobiaceae bacterium]|nr:hypothetical protein [Ancalomicrobiaceae bacterium]